MQKNKKRQKSVLALLLCSMLIFLANSAFVVQAQETEEQEGVEETGSVPTGSSEVSSLGSEQIDSSVQPDSGDLASSQQDASSWPDSSETVSSEETANALMAPAVLVAYPMRYEWASIPALGGTVVAPQYDAGAKRVEAVLPDGFSASSALVPFTQEYLDHVFYAMGVQYGLDVPGWAELTQGYIVNNSGYDYTVTAIYIDPNTVFHSTAPLNLSAAMIATLQTNPAYADFYAANAATIDAIASAGNAAKNGGKALVQSLAGAMAVPGGPDGYTRLLLDTYAPGGLTAETATAMMNAIMFTTAEWGLGLYANYTAPLDNAGSCLLTDLTGLYASSNLAVCFGPEKLNYKSGGLPADCPYLLRNYFPSGLSGDALVQQLGEEATIEQGENVLHMSAQPSGPNYNNYSGLSYMTSMDVGFYVVLQRVGALPEEEFLEEPEPVSTAPQPQPQPQSDSQSQSALPRSSSSSPATAPSSSSAALPVSSGASLPPPASSNVDVVIPSRGMPFLATPGAHWALANLLLVVVTGVVALLLLPGLLHRREDNLEEAAEAEMDENGGNAPHRLWRIMALFSFVLGVVMFFITEDIRLPVAFADDYTLMMLVFPIVAVVAAVMARRSGKRPENGKT